VKIQAIRNYAEDARRDPGATSHATRLLLVAKRLERIGDYVTDICEQIVYMKEATVIKHQRSSS
jgi:phosphate transport system protein